MHCLNLGISFKHNYPTTVGFTSGTVVKNPPANEGDIGDVGSILGSGRSPGGGNGNLVQYSGLANSNDR